MGAPLTHLDARLDDLSVALARTPNLDDLIAGLFAYEALLDLIPTDHPELVDALALAPVWTALGEVAVEIRALRRMKEH